MTMVAFHPFTYSECKDGAIVADLNLDEIEVFTLAAAHIENVPGVPYYERFVGGGFAPDFVFNCDDAMPVASDIEYEVRELQVNIFAFGFYLVMDIDTPSELISDIWELNEFREYLQERL